MFKRLRNQFQDKNAAALPSQESAPSQNNQHSGFICPMCMINLNSPEQLQLHFETAHSSTETQQQPPSADKMNKQEASASDPPSLEKKTQSILNHSNGDTTALNSVESNIDSKDMNSAEKVEALREEINDLKSSLNEEKWFTTELKNELDNNKAEKDQFSEECSVLKKQIAIALETNEELAKQKEAVEKKAAQMAQSMAEIKALNDEYLSDKQSAEERCSNQSVELEKAAAWVRDLESQLLQRPGADDVMVLKKELVSVQTLMDQMTLESEEKGKEVEKERERLQMLLDEARTQAEEVQKDFDAYKEENARLRSEKEESAAAKNEKLQEIEEEKKKLNDLLKEREVTWQEENARLHSENEKSAAASHEKFQQIEEEKKKLNDLLEERQVTWQEELNNLQSSLEKEQAYSKSLELETNRLQEERIAMDNDINKLSEECRKLNGQNEEEKNRNKELLKQLTDLKTKSAQVELNLSNAQEEMANLKLDGVNKLAENKNLLSAISKERDDVTMQLRESRAQVDELNRSKTSLEEQITELRTTIKQSDSESSSVRHQLEIELAQMRIKLEKLEDDNKLMLEQKNEAIQNLEDVRTKYEEERKSFQNQQLESDRQLINFKLKIGQLEEERNQKMSEVEEFRRRITSLESAHNEIREKNQTLNTDLALKLQEINSLKERLDQSSLKLDEEVERRDKAAEEASKLREERTHLIAQMEAGEGEAAARVQLSEENEVLRKEKEAAEERWRSEVKKREADASEMKMKANELNLLLTSTQEKCYASEQLVAQLREESRVEHEKLVQAEAEVKAKCDLLASSEAAAVTQRADVENHLHSVQRSLKEKTKEHEKIMEELSSARSSLEHYKAQLSEVKQNHHVELATVRASLERCEKEKKEAAMDAGRLQDEIKRLKESHSKDVSLRKKEAKEIEAKHAERIGTLQSDLDDAHSKVFKISEDLKKESSVRLQVEVELNQVKRQLGDREEKNAKVQSKLDKALASLDKQNKDMQRAMSETTKLSEEIEQATLKITGLNTRIEGNEKAIKSKSDENSALQELIKSKIIELEEEQALRVTSQKAHSDAMSIINEKESCLEELKSSFEKECKEKMELIEKLNSDLSQRTVTISQFEQDLDSLKKQKMEKETLLGANQTRIEELESNLKKERSKLEDHTSLLTDTEVDLKNSKMELENLRSKLGASETEVKSLEQEKKNLIEQSAEQRDVIADMQNQLEESRSSNQELHERLQLVKKRFEELQDQMTTRTSEWNKQKANYTSELDKLQANVKRLDADVQKEKESLEEVKVKSKEETNILQREMEEKEKEWATERQIFEEKNRSLESSQNLLIGHKVEMQSNIDRLQAEVDRHKQLLEEAEESASKQKKSKDDVIAAFKSQLESKNRELESAEAERVVSESRLQLEIGTLSENLNSTRAEWVTSTQKVDSLTREVDELRGQLLVLDTTIQSNNDERRALLERCLHAEQDAEQRKEKNEELKRKLDDAHSAMHELGRENQALQVKHNTTISRQWTDDRTSVQCRACNRAFSITVRRHHCRHCGEIFCNDCSSRTATVAASKNPVRVCERCYDELSTAK